MADPFEVQLSATPALVNAGATFVLAWSITGGQAALTASIDQGVGNVLAVTGHQTVTINKATNYTITVTDRIGQVRTSTISVGVSITTIFPGLNAEYQEQGHNHALPYVTYQSQIDTGINFNTYCTPLPGAVVDTTRYVNGRWTGWVVAKFSEVYTFTVDPGDIANYCNNNVLLGALTLTVNGVPLLAVDHFDPAGPQSATIVLTAGVPVTLLLGRSAPNEDYFTVFQWQSASQAKQVVPTSALYYQLPTTVVYPAIQGSITADDATITAGQSTTVRWTSTDADAVTINGAGAALSGSMSVSPTVTTTYTEVMTGANAITEARSVTVTVTAIPTVPGATFTADGVSNCGVIVLAWSPVAVATAYNLLRSTTPGGPYTLRYTGTDLIVNDSSVDPTINPIPYVTYYYVLQVVINGVAGPNSVEVNAFCVTSPTTPAGVTVTPYPGGLSIGWTAVAHASYYQVFRGLTPGSETLLTQVTAAGYFDYLPGGGTYFYKVRAVNNCGLSVKSAEVSGTAEGITSCSVIDRDVDPAATSANNPAPTSHITTQAPPASTSTRVAGPTKTWS